MRRILIPFLLLSWPLLAQFGETVVVTGGAFPAPLKELAPQATILTARDLEERKIVSVDEAIRQTLSAVVLRSGTPGKASSLFLRGADSDHALVLLNGIPVSNSSFSGYNYGDLLTAGLSRIEIVRGPYSALYGSEAMAGVVSLFTDGAKRDALSLSLSSGGYGLAQGDVSVDQGRFHLTLARHTEDGRLPNDGWTQIQGIISYDGGPIGFTLVGRDGDVGIPLNMGEPSPERRQRTQEYTLAVPIQTELSETWKVQADAGYTWNRLRFDDPQDSSGYTFGDTKAGRAFVKTTLLNEGPVWKQAFGVEARRDTVTDENTFGTSLDGKSTSDGAVFMEETGSLGRLGIRAGLRLDHHSEFGNSLNPKLSFVFPFKSVRFHLQAGTAFRAPSMGELYFSYSGNPNLHPEKSTSVEAGISGEGFTLNAFQSSYTNLIEFNYASYAFQNAGKSHIQGLEFQAFKAVGRARMDVTATWLDAKNVSTGEALLRRPKFSGSWTLTVPLSSFSLTASGLYVGKRADIDAVTFARVDMDPFYRQDLVLAYENPRLLNPFLKMENVFGSAYQEIAGYPSLGRRFSAGVRWNMEFKKP